MVRFVDKPMGTGRSLSGAYVAVLDARTVTHPVGRTP
jgi:hypothetical protein